MNTVLALIIFLHIGNTMITPLRKVSIVKEKIETDNGCYYIIVLPKGKDCVLEGFPCDYYDVGDIVKLKRSN